MLNEATILFYICVCILLLIILKIIDCFLNKKKSNKEHFDWINWRYFFSSIFSDMLLK